MTHESPVARLANDVASPSRKMLGFPLLVVARFAVSESEPDLSLPLTLRLQASHVSDDGLKTHSPSYVQPIMHSSIDTSTGRQAPMASATGKYPRQHETAQDEGRVRLNTMLKSQEQTFKQRIKKGNLGVHLLAFKGRF